MIFPTPKCDKPSYDAEFAREIYDLFRLLHSIDLERTLYYVFKEV